MEKYPIWSFGNFVVYLSIAAKKKTLYQTYHDMVVDGSF
jgi:hypothetical protein